MHVSKHLTEDIHTGGMEKNSSVLGAKNVGWNDSVEVWQL